MDGTEELNKELDRILAQLENVKERLDRMNDWLDDVAIALEKRGERWASQN